jgi:DNA-binding NarL/FixJ family response regulator
MLGICEQIHENRGIFFEEPAMEPVRLVIADDHPLIRAGIRSLLQSIPNIEVVGEAADGVRALELVASLRPQLLLTDIKMPSMNGLQVAETVARDFPDVRVIILSMYSDEEFVTKAIRSNAAGYLLKDSTASEFEFAIKAAIRGEVYVSPAISNRMMSRLKGLTSKAGQGDSEPLTVRQREILRMVAEGASTKMIAKALSISPKTVETHRAHIMQRLDIHDVPGLVRYAMRTGLIPSES